MTSPTPVAIFEKEIREMGDLRSTAKYCKIEIKICEK